MKMNKLYIRNYRMFKDVLINLNSGCNIFVGDNNSGKTTLLEIIQVLLSGRINNSSFERQFKASFLTMNLASILKKLLQILLTKSKNCLL